VSHRHALLSGVLSTLTNDVLLNVDFYNQVAKGKRTGIFAVIIFIVNLIWPFPS
jgi:hypothetical protein